MTASRSGAAFTLPHTARCVRRQLTGLMLEKCLVFDDAALGELLQGLQRNLRALSLCGNHNHMEKLEGGTVHFLPFLCIIKVSAEQMQRNLHALRQCGHHDHLAKLEDGTVQFLSFASSGQSVLLLGAADSAHAVAVRQPQPPGEAG